MVEMCDLIPCRKIFFIWRLVLKLSSTKKYDPERMDLHESFVGGVSRKNPVISADLLSIVLINKLLEPSICAFCLLIVYSSTVRPFTCIGPTISFNSELRSHTLCEIGYLAIYV